MKKIKIAVIGQGYVGFSNSILLAQKNTVIAIDTNVLKVNKINKHKSPIIDDDGSKFLKNSSFNLKASVPYKGMFKDVNYALIATPTNYDEETHCFNTTSVENTIEIALYENPSIVIIIRSTVPVGFTEQMTKRFKKTNLYFVPEFLREGSAIKDNLFPSRIIIGGRGDKIESVKALLKESVIKKDVEVLTMSSSEAESSKLFSNTYLAMRIAFLTN